MIDQRSTILRLLKAALATHRALLGRHHSICTKESDMLLSVMLTDAQVHPTDAAIIHHPAREPV